MIEFLPTFVVTVFSVTEGAWPSPARMLLIVRRPYAHLEEQLRSAFAGRSNVEVIPDRRRGERRRGNGGAAVERRRGERRTSKEEILEVVIQGDPLTMFE